MYDGSMDNAAYTSGMENDKMKYKTDLTQHEIEYLQRTLPDTITRRGRTQELSASKHDNKYCIWYGTIISGNFMSQDENLLKSTMSMLRYIECYKDMDESTFSRLGIRHGICLHCDISLEESTDNTYYFCPKCKLCYEPYSIIGMWFFRLYRWLWKKFMEILIRNAN